VVVNFDGMGPTWTVLVKKGLELYPNATHGVLSDADFTPTITSLDKWQLKLECSKHMYRIRCAMRRRVCAGVDFEKPSQQCVA
jgi:hypothetical protein